MDLETFLIAVYCLTDDALHAMLHGVRLRQRGPAPRPLSGATAVYYAVTTRERRRQP